MRRAQLFWRLAFPLTGALALAACGQGAEEGSGGLTAQLRSQCIAQVEGAAIGSEVADTICDCAARRAQESLDLGDLVTGDTTQVETIVAQCAEEYLSGDDAVSRADEAEVK